MYAFVEAMKSAGSVDDVKAIREHMQDGLTNMAAEQKIYDIPTIDENGGFASKLSLWSGRRWKSSSHSLR